MGVSGSEDLHQTFRELSLSETRVDRVVIAARWDLYFSPSSKYYFGNRALSESAARRDALEAFGRLIREKVESNKRVTVLLSTPNGEGLNPKLYAKRGFFAMPEIRRVDYTRSQHIEYHGEMLREIASVAVINGAEVVDPLEHLCEGEVCIAENDEGPIRYDANHLRPGFVRDHVKFLDTTVSP